MRGLSSDAVPRKDAMPPASLRKRLGWFVLLYAAGVAAVLLVAGIFHVLVLGRL